MRKYAKKKIIMRNGREHRNYNTSSPLALCMMLVICSHPQRHRSIRRSVTCNNNNKKLLLLSWSSYSFSIKTTTLPSGLINSKRI